MRGCRQGDQSQALGRGLRPPWKGHSSWCTCRCAARSSACRPASPCPSPGSSASAARPSWAAAAAGEERGQRWAWGCTGGDGNVAVSLLPDCPVVFSVCVCQSPAPPGAGPACEGKEEEDEEEDEEGRSLPRAAAWGADPQGAAYQLRLALHRLADQLLDLFALAAPRLGVAAVALPALRHGSKLCIAHPPAPAGGTRGAAGGGGRGLGGAGRPRGPTWGVLGCSGTSPEGVSARTWK